ncbi:MAG TPA: MEDS domain-containing protein [Nocardioidaceae bacterium]
MRRLRVLERAEGFSPGDHASWVFDGDGSFTSAAAECLAEGARRGERLMFVTSTAAGSGGDALDAVPAGQELLDRGQLTVHRLEDVYRIGSQAGPAAQARLLEAELDRALAAGFTGLRVASDLTELAADDRMLPRLMEYELAVDQLFSGRPAVVLCGFDSRTTGPSWPRLAALHGMQHAPEPRPRFAVRLLGKRLYLQGELDVVTAPELSEALATAASCTHDDLHVDLTGLDFIDVAAGRVLAGFDRRMCRDGRQVTFDGARPLAARVLRCFGVPRQPGLGTG